MSPAHTGLIAALMALGLVFAATPAVADESTGPTPVGCLNLMLSRIGAGLAVYTALNNVVGFGISTDQPGEGAEVAIMVVPSACGAGGLPATEINSLMGTAQGSPTLPSLP